MGKQLIVPVFIPHQGCNNACVFCNQRKIAGEYELPKNGEIEQMVNEYRKSYKELIDVEIQVAFYGGSFTGLSIELQEYLLGEAVKLKKQGLIHKIRMSTRPDYIDQSVIKRLIDYQVDIVELGVQSLDEHVLVSSKRGHFVEDVYRAVAQIRETPIELGIQIMVGLPEDNRQRSIETTEKVIELKPDFVRIYPTIVIQDTELAQMWRAGQYQALTIEEAIECCGEQSILLERAEIPIVRIGLQATEGLDRGEDWLAGPYHPAFGELVKARVFRKQLEMLLANLEQNSKQEIDIYCNNSEISQVTGQKKANIAYFNERYQIKLTIKGMRELEKGELAMVMNGATLILTKKAFLERYERN